MQTTKYSRQRESILQYLYHTKEHPTADTIYLHVRKSLPNVSLGTIYRNLTLLEQQGVIQKLPTPGCDRFDGNPNPHYHFTCVDCGAVTDLNMPYLDHINTLASANFPGSVTGHNVSFYGRCQLCKQEYE